MRKFLLAMLMMSGCGSDSDVYTWGDLSYQVSLAYCEALNKCEYLDKDRVSICADHSMWHLCVPDSTCETEIDEDDAVAAMDACDAALKVAVKDPNACFVIAAFNVLPPECQAVFDLAPEPEE